MLGPKRDHGGQGPWVGGAGFLMPFPASGSEIRVRALGEGPREGVVFLEAPPRPWFLEVRAHCALPPEGSVWHSARLAQKQHLEDKVQTPSPQYRSLWHLLLPLPDSFSAASVSHQPLLLEAQWLLSAKATLLHTSAVCSAAPLAGVTVPVPIHLTEACHSLMPRTQLSTHDLHVDDA